MKIVFRIIMCFVYYWLFTVFLSLTDWDAPPVKMVIPLWTAFCIHIGLKLLFITLQDKDWTLHAGKFVLEIILIYIFAPDVIILAVVAAIMIPVGIAWSNVNLASHLVTGRGALEVRRALGRAVSGRSHSDGSW